MNNTRKLLTVATLAAASFAGTASAATQSPESWFGPEPVAQGPALSRAEVLADLSLWTRAGLREYSQGERSIVDSPDYAAKLAEYHRLRSGPAYQAEVRRLGGEANALASQAAERTAH